MRQRVFLFFASIFQLFLFAFLSYLVHKGFFNRIDFDLTVKLQDHLSRRFDYPFSVFSLLGSFEVTGVSFLLIYFLSLRKIRRLFLIFSFPLLHVFELLGKLFIYHPGPPFMFLRYTFGFHFPSSYVQTNYSYPSGHVTRTVFLSGILFFLILKSKLGVVKKLFFYFLLGIICGVMIISRIYLGEHWFSDTLGGVFLGLSISTLTASMW
jgi:undecaprenyl-diphosphatase